MSSYIVHTAISFSSPLNKLGKTVEAKPMTSLANMSSSLEGQKKCHIQIFQMSLVI